MSDALINGLAGAGGGIIAQLITYPLQTMLQVVQQEGWGGYIADWHHVLAALFAGILTMRPWNRVIDHAVNHLSIQGNASDHSELQEKEGLICRNSQNASALWILQFRSALALWTQYQFISIYIEGRNHSERNHWVFSP